MAKELQINPEELRNYTNLSKDISGQTTWHKVALRGKVELLEKLCDWAKKIQLNPEELRKEVCLSEDNSGQTSWHQAALRGNFEVLEKLCDWAKKKNYG